MDKITAQNNGSVKDYIASLDEQTVKDSQVLIEMMQRISGHEPKLWNVGTIGFDTYHYKYDSGREGDGHVIGFYPRVSTSWATATFGRTMTKASSVGLLLWDNGDGQGLLQQPGLTLAPGQVS